MIALAYGLYFAIFTGLFLWTRSNNWTEEEALPPEGKKPGFGAQITLLQAVKGMFRFGGPRVLVVACAVSLIARLFFLEFGLVDLGVVLSIALFWPFQEWLIHAWLEHMKPMRVGGRDVELLITKTHRAHHRNPWAPEYGLTTTYFVVAFVGGVPMLWSIPFQLGFLSLPAALTGNLVTFALILNYEWIHYLIHTSYVPRGKFYRRLWRNHRLHHFQNENYWYGLTMLSGDRFLGTQPEQSVASRSDTVMNLGVDHAETQNAETVNANDNQHQNSGHVEAEHEDIGRADPTNARQTVPKPHLRSSATNASHSESA